MHLRPNADNRERAIISKSSTVLWALVLFAIAVYSIKAGGKGHVVEIGLSIASVAYGCLLGVFLLGTLTRFATQTGATIGMVFGFVLNLWLWQGTFPMHLGPLTIPHVAWTWYVLIGAAATFGIGSLASFIFGKQSTRRKALAMVALPLMTVILSGALSAQSKNPDTAKPATTAQTTSTSNAQQPDFTPISTLINDAIAAHKLPGVVALIGHNGKVVFEQAYGDRKLAGEPGYDVTPLTEPAIPKYLSPSNATRPDAAEAEPMTEDTIFDMASLSKCLSTATAIMQLYEQGKLNFDDPIEKYFPAFNPTHDPQRAQVTIRMLLTHTSGERPDIDLKDAWGLAAPDKAEGIHRALTTPLQSTPGEVFRYSDINFILLGDLVETLSGQSLDVYAQQHIFKPLGMTETRYLPFAKACGAFETLGAAVLWESNVTTGKNADGTTWTRIRDYRCSPSSWIPLTLIPRIAPEAHDNEGTATTNPDFDHLLRGTVHDPTTRRMGGVAGHAGVFSTAHDISLFAQALLDRLAGRPSNFPLKQSTLELMTTPEQPGHNPNQITAANAAEQAAIAAGDKPSAPLLAPHYPAIKGQDLRGYGWDIDTAYSKPRGLIFPIGSFGHTGFTGTSLWMDPGSDTYVILLANSIHPRGNPPISNLRGQVATAAAQALDEYEDVLAASTGCAPLSACDPPERIPRPTLTGIDVLESTHFAALHGIHAFGLLTNQTGLDAQGRRTIDILYSLRTNNHHLTTIFSPEHGIFGKQDSMHINTEVDPTTGLHVTSLYGPTDADKRPSHEQLKDLDAVIIDLQDAGIRFYTYDTVTGYFLEAAAREQTEYHHDLEIIILDRPDIIGGTQVQGPISDPGLESYIDYMPLPVRHGLTLGELARYIDGTKHLNAHLTVIPMQHWSRTEYFDATGLLWHNPSPNLRSLTAATLYPGLGFLDFSNISVGRGTRTPFELFGASWLHAADVAAALTVRNIPGVTFSATTTTVAEDANRYPFHGQTIDAVRITLTDRTVLDSPELGIEILSALHHLYPTQFQLDKTLRLIGNRTTLDALQRGDDARTIAASWVSALDAFKASRAPYLLYP
jgi:uncharacterized protein YbbC (DUF1343 family)/CubicO group peptidase (beta-lactamase class C family)